MVKLLSLEATNFKRLNLQHPLEFGEGITLIHGQNESGKSTILDAILFSLFTRTIRPSARPRDEDILQYNTNKLVLRLLFKVENRTFLVERRIHRNKPNEAFLSEKTHEGTLHAMATKVNSVNDEISKLLGGLSFDEIIASNVVAQKELNKIVNLHLHDRIAVINAFLRLESFTEAAKKLADEKQGIEGTKSILGMLPIAKQRLHDLEIELEDWKAKSTELKDAEDSRHELERKTEQDKVDYKKFHEIFTTLETYQRQLANRKQITSDIRNKTETRDGIKKQLDGVATKQNELSSLNDQAREYEGLESLTNTVIQLNAEADKLQRLQVQVQTMEESTPVNREELKNDSVELQKNSGRVGIQEAEGIRRSARMLMVASGMLVLAGVALGALVNPFLFALVLAGGAAFGYAVLRTGKASALMTQHADYLAKAESHELRTTMYTDYQNSLSTMRDQVIQARNHLSNAISTFPKNHETPWATTDDLVQIARDIKTKFDEATSKSAILLARMSELKKDLRNKPTLEQQENNFIDQIKNLQTKLDTITLPELPQGVEYSDELLGKTKTQDQTLHDSILKNETDIKNMKDTIGKLSKFLEEKKDLPRKTEEQAKNVQTLERRLRVINEARTGIDKTSEALRGRVKPSVEYYMSTFLPSVTMNRYKAVQLDEDYRLSVWDAEAGEYRPREVFSGGTEDQLLLVMRLAFALALTPETKGTRPEFVFLDEPLGSSDENRRAEIIHLLKGELAQYFSQILLISHVQGLEQKVDRMVRLENGRIAEQL